MSVRRRTVAIAATVLLIALGLLTGTAEAAPARPAAATRGCRAVGGGAVDTGGGPARATVVVDTGSGAVWSACISFSGSISGIEALERAEAVITDLDPVYDQYSGLGKAVCRLRGVGTDPPDCLGKSTSYWSYSHNGRVASVGAGSVTVRDGDVQGWRYGTGGGPRAATTGTEATSAPPPTTTQPPATTAPPVATTAPASGGAGGGLTSSPTGGTDGPAESPEGPTGTTPGGRESEAGTPTTDAASVEGAADEADVEDEGGSEDPASVAGAQNDDEGASGAEEAAAASGGAGSASSGTTGSGGSPDGGSALPSILGFLAALAAVAGAGVLVRRRRTADTSAPGAPPVGA